MRFVTEVLCRAGSSATGIEAAELIALLIGTVPLITTGVAGFDPVARLATIDVGIRVSKIARPVLFGCQVGVPGRDPVGTVVQGATRHQAFRAVLGNEVLRARHRARELHGRLGGNAAVQGILHHFPLALLIGANAHDTHAVGIHLLDHLIGIAAAIVMLRKAIAVQRQATGRCVQKAWFHVFMVEHQQTVGGAAVQRKEVHAVVMAAHLMRLLLPGSFQAERGHIARDGRPQGMKLCTR